MIIFFTNAVEKVKYCRSSKYKYYGTTSNNIKVITVNAVGD